MAARVKTAQGTRGGRGPAARVLRIIGGRWRGRKLRFPADADIRPTPDRVRETLFNWLAPELPGARCLDLFAGSGALCLEALSRGAAAVTFVDRDAAAIRELRARLEEWQAVGAQLARADALSFLAGTPSQYQVVFLDPPYAAGLLPPCAAALATRGWLAPGARVYVECAAREGLPALPPGFELVRSKRAGEVGYHLYGYPAAAAAP